MLMNRNIMYATLLSLAVGAAGLAWQSRDRGSAEFAAVAGAPQGAALRDPMAAAVGALGDLTARLAQGDLQAARAAHATYAKSFGEVLGPLSFLDVNLAQRIANANSAISDQMEGEQPDRAAVVREAAVVVDGLQQAAVAMGVSLTARAGAEIGAAAPAEGPAQVFPVTAREYFFTPNRIEVKEGDRVTIRLTNAGKEQHEWEVEDLDVELKPLAPGATGEVTFVAGRKGTYDFWCDLEGHHHKGMKGTLVVR